MACHHFTHIHIFMYNICSQRVLLEVTSLSHQSFFEKKDYKKEKKKKKKKNLTQVVSNKMLFLCASSLSTSANNTFTVKRY